MKPNGGNESFPFRAKYILLSEEFRRNIDEGTWAAGAQIPVEAELSRSLSASINTVRRAVGILVDEGLLIRRQGAGTFVAAPGTRISTRRLVGVLIPSTTYYYPRVVEGLQRVLHDAGIGIVLASSGYDLDRERDELQALVDSGVEGLLFAPNLHLMDDPARYIRDVRELPIPSVLMERRPPSPDPEESVSYVATDAGAGVHRALRHLSALGHTRVGHMGRLRTGTSSAVSGGFDTAARLLAIDAPAAAVVRHETWVSEDISAYLDACLAERVTAVFCHGDRDAAALIVEARRRGLRVPQDLAVIAYDDEVAEVGDIPLTAVSPTKADVGEMAARLLLRQLESGPGHPSYHVEILPRLIVRASCGGSADA